VFGKQTSNRVDFSGALFHLRMRCMAWMFYRAMDLIAMRRMLGRATASQIASASLASFLWLFFTYGFSNRGAISFTVCLCNFLAQ
jgi:hypothetical protein